jgi:hypothetical protein
MEICFVAGFDAELPKISGRAQRRMIDRAPHRAALTRHVAPSQQNATGGDTILEQNPTEAIYKTRRRLEVSEPLRIHPGPHRG